MSQGELVRRGGSALETILISVALLVVSSLAATAVLLTGQAGLDAAQHETRPYSGYDIPETQDVGGGSASGSGKEAAETPEPVSPAPEVTVQLPTDCADVYSSSLTSTLTGAGAVLNPSASVAAQLKPIAGTGDTGLRELLRDLPRLECRWLSATGAKDWGVETSIALLSEAEASEVRAELQTTGFRALKEADGTRYVLEKTLSDGSGHYGESHIVVGSYWFATYWSKYGPSGYTADIVAQVVR